MTENEKSFPGWYRGLYLITIFLFQIIETIETLRTYTNTQNT